MHGQRFFQSVSATSMLPKMYPPLAHLREDKMSKKNTSPNGPADQRSYSKVDSQPKQVRVNFESHHQASRE
jgi:hypothetical protein